MASPNPKLKRVLAWVGIILLVGMYLVTLVFALLGSEQSPKLVVASVAMTIVIPVLIYAMQMAYQIVSAGKNDGSKVVLEDEEDAEVSGPDPDGLTETEAEAQTGASGKEPEELKEQ